MSEQRRSPAYPSFDIEKASEYVRTLGSKERLQSVPLDVAALGLGYKGLNGASRGIFATLKQYGFIAYQSDGGKVSLLVFTDMARDLVQPVQPGDETRVKVRAFDYPKIYRELKEAFPGWDLPSEENLHNRLCRHYGFGEDAARELQKVLRRNLEIVQALDSGTEPQAESSRVFLEDLGEPPPPKPPSEPLSVGGQEAQLQRLIMPGSEVYLAMPRSLDARNGHRMLRWLDGVVKPAIQFAIEGDEVEE